MTDSQGTLWEEKNGNWQLGGWSFSISGYTGEGDTYDHCWATCPRCAAMVKAVNSWI